MLVRWAHVKKVWYRKTEIHRSKDHNCSSFMNASMDSNDVIGGEPAGSPWWVWLGLSAISCASFWSQATVTEER